MQIVSVFLMGTARRMGKLLEKTGLILTDAVGVITYADDAASRLFAHSPERLRGTQLAELLPGLGDNTGPGDSGGRNEAPAIGASGTPRYLVGAGSDGRSVPLVVTMLKTPESDDAGFIVTVMPRPRLPANSEYSEAVAMSAAIVEANLDALVTIDEAGYVIEFSRNAEQMFGYRREDILGRALHELIIPPSLREAHCQGMKHYLETGEGPVLRQRIEIKAMRADDSIFPVELTVTPIELGDRTLFTAFIRDITERKNIEDNLELAKNEADLANQAKTRFLATMSHEIRTPMTAVLGAIGLLLDSALGCEQHNYAATADRAGQALLAIINDVLDFSRIESGQLELSYDKFGLVNVIEESADLLTRRASEKNIELATWVDPQVPESLSGDPARLRQILINLLDNAVRFTDSGAIAIRAKLAERAPDDSRLLIRFEVQDTGIGIGKDDQTAMFEEFTQVKTPSGKDAGGSGLGLAICRRLVDLFSGEIGVESNGTIGSTFWFTAWLDVVSPEVPRQKIGIAPRRVLVVWNNDLARETLLTCLRDHRLIAEHAESGRDALTLIEKRGRSAAPFDVVMVNDALPDMTSAEFHHDLEQIDDIRQPDTYLLDSRTATDSTSTSHPANWSGVLTKPITLSGLNRAFAVSATGESGNVESAPSLREGGRVSRRLTDGRVLLVEDSEANTIVLRGMLESAGCSLDCVENGKAALEAVQDKRYALVLMDLRMPVMDGLEATRRIRALDTPHSKTPIIAMTAGVVREELEEFLEAGADAYITKPVVKSDLLRMVSNWLEAQVQADTAELFQGEDAQLVDHQALSRLERDTSPDAVPAMLELFLKEMRQRMDAVTGMLADGDLKGIGEQAHAMKSSAGTFGAHRLQLLAEALDAACRENERERALTLAQRLPQVARISIRAFEPFR
jgi:PAS domain S-box-containing protein